MLSSNKTIYPTRTGGGQHGTVYTNPVFARFMLDTAGFISTRDLKDIRVLEPAAGDGVFLMELLHRFKSSSKKYGWMLEECLAHIKAVEIDENAASKLKSKVASFLVEARVLNAESIADKMVVCDDFLTSSVADTENYDLVIGNPPYIRHEHIPSIKKSIYRKLFPTFRHRSDIYIAFFEKGLRVLAQKGQLVYVCSDRWLKAKYGEELRMLIAQEFGVKAVIEVDSKEAFDTKVDAYASIIMINSQKSTSYDYAKIYYKDEDFHFSSLERRSAPSRESWFDHFSWNDAAELQTIEAQGFKIGIGVATGADKIFIGKNIPVETELLLPVVLSRDIASGKIAWSGNKVLNPYNHKTGSLIDLNDYPRAKAYLGEFYDVLAARHAAKLNPNKWYKTIDRIQIQLLGSPKLLIPDMKKDRFFPVSTGGLYPHHNLYYITGKSVDDLKILSVLLSTEFVKKQIEAASVTMKGGYVRWQSQNLRKIRLPLLSNMHREAKEQLSKAYKEKDSISAEAVLMSLIELGNGKH